MPIKKGKPTQTNVKGVRKDGENRYLVVRQWIDPRTGKRKKKEKVVLGSLEDAVVARDRLRNKEATRKRSRMRLRAYGEQWLADNVDELSPAARDRYTPTIAHIDVGLGDYYLDQLKVQDIRHWMRKQRKTYAAATVNGWHRVLKVVLDDAVLDGLCHSNPARKVRALKEGRTRGPRGTALTQVQFRSFLEAVEELKGGDLAEDVARLVLAAAWTGMRRGELLALRWADYADGELLVSRSVYRRQERPTKTDEPRLVVVAKPLAQALEDQRQWLLKTQHSGLSSELVFPASRQQAMAGAARRKGSISWYRSPSVLTEAVKLIAAKAGVPEISAHSLRRTYENLLRRAGVDQLVRRSLAGWRSEKTQAIYARVQPEERRAAADALVALVGIHPGDTP